MIITKDTPGVICISDQSGECYQWDGDLNANEDLTIALNSLFTIKGSLNVNGSITVDCTLDVCDEIRIMYFATFSYDVVTRESIFVGCDMICSDITAANGNIVCGHNLLSSGYVSAFNGNIVVGGTLVACQSIAQDKVMAGTQIISMVKPEQQKNAT